MSVTTYALHQVCVVAGWEQVQWIGPLHQPVPLAGQAIMLMQMLAADCAAAVARTTALLCSSTKSDSYLALCRSSTKSKLLALLCFALRAFALQRPVAFVKHRLHRCIA